MSGLPCRERAIFSNTGTAAAQDMDDFLLAGEVLVIGKWNGIGR
jgi:hypothetical protein